MPMLRVAICFALACDDVGVGLLGKSGIDVAVQYLVFFCLVFWLSNACSIIGLQYCSMSGVLLVLRMDLWGVDWAA